MKKFLLIAAFAALALSLTACGGGNGGIPNGRFVTDNAMVAMTGFSSFEFSGNQVTVGMMNDMVTHNNLRYTFENNTLSITIEGSSVNLPLEIVNNNTLNVQGTEFVRE